LALAEIAVSFSRLLKLSAAQKSRKGALIHCFAMCAAAFRCTVLSLRSKFNIKMRQSDKQ
jgi:hypothetical protein